MMKDSHKLPRTLQEAIQYFSDQQTCLDLVAQLRWPDGPVCPRCASKEYRFIKTRSLWECKGCKKQYSVKVGTIFEDSPIKLDKWLCALWMLVNCKNGISSYEVGRALGVTQKTAWFMMHRLRLALHCGSFDKKLNGPVEADETYIGGLARNMHWKKREALKSTGEKGKGRFGKAVVMGMLERNGEVRAKVLEGAFKKDLHDAIRQHVKQGAELITDEHMSYQGLYKEYAHRVINHAQTYVEGSIHTNGIENFWSLLKRGIKGTYVSVEPFHLFRYLDEQTFRFNARKQTDQDRFIQALSTIHGRRLTYQHLTSLPS